MMPDAPDKSVRLEIPDTCRMRREFTGDYDIHVMFGDVSRSLPRLEQSVDCRFRGPLDRLAMFLRASINERGA